MSEQIINWKALQPRERDALVAEKVFERTIDRSMTFGQLLMFRDGSNALTEVIPHYTTDDVWSVVDHLRLKRFDIHVASAPFQYDALIMDRRMGGKDFEASAQSAPEAICIAALKCCGCEVMS